MFKALEDAFEWAPLPLRIGLAAVFGYAGIMKVMNSAMTIEGFTGMGFPMPEATAWFVAIIEIIGAIALLLGFLTRIATIPLTIILVVAAIVTYGTFDMGMTLQLVAMIGGLLTLLMTGPGKWSLDEKFYWE